MKKIIFIITFTLVAISANAQLNVKSVTKEKPTQIMSLQMAYSALYKFEDGYVIAMNTNNKFDKHQTLILLGDSLESALQTSKDLKEIIDTETALVEVSQGDYDLTLTYQNNLGVKQLYVKQSGNAGFSWLTLKQIEKIIAYFESELG